MMQNSTKFLMGIVAGMVLLIAVTFLVVLRRSEPTYQDDNSPGGAAYNYLLAIQNQDYDKAFTYIPTLYPHPKDAEEMAYTIERADVWRFDIDSDFSLAVESVDMRGDDRAIITVRKTTFYNTDLFGSGQSSTTFPLTMRLVEDRWKVFDGERYWSRSCWGFSHEKWCD